MNQKPNSRGERISRVLCKQILIRFSLHFPSQKDITYFQTVIFLSNPVRKTIPRFVLRPCLSRWSKLWIFFNPIYVYPFQFGHVRAGAHKNRQRLKTPGRCKQETSSWWWRSHFFLNHKRLRIKRWHLRLWQSTVFIPHRPSSNDAPYHFSYIFL